MHNVDFADQSPAILSFCPGILGLERGIKRVFPRATTTAYVEIETFIVENLLSAMETGLVDAAPVWTNLKTFNPKPFRGKVDILLGGYPCQPFSLAGNRGGTEDPRHLYPYIESSIATIRPVCCFFENVAGHLSMGFSEVSESLRNLGYRVEAGIYTAEEVGATHERERLFILAILEDADGDRSWRNNEGRFQSEIIGTSEELEHSGFEPLEGGISRDIIDQERWEKSDGSFNKSGDSSELANSGDIGFGGRGNLELDGGFENSTTVWASVLPETERYSSQMANTNNNGSDATENGQGDSERNDGNQARQDKFFQSKGFSNSGHNDRFPAGQGEYQFDWEEPRTIESSVEYTINGYNFTEDLHRAIGNSVVEQTAELAFRDLLKKHSINIQ